ncbi:hypothetical protein TSOC_006337 [Tetrabaena socialis]|uniref:Uncharacterized protein n=1 Tax=Tetrabaena socialis TaxID=47790 RepID=A0A2J8A415_9CHLO|nr:hypothetical protein TSOC_006337 [Tetrabaena socialis]|eukprot:PNH07247.1 hypothetical protein TSOC_006337 [Tetrabaena socialis]
MKRSRDQDIPEPERRASDTNSELASELVPRIHSGLPALPALGICSDATIANDGHQTQRRRLYDIPEEATVGLSSAGLEVARRRTESVTNAPCAPSRSQGRPAGTFAQDIDGLQRQMDLLCADEQALLQELRTGRAEYDARVTTLSASLAKSGQHPQRRGPPPAALQQQPASAAAPPLAPPAASAAPRLPGRASGGSTSAAPPLPPLPLLVAPGGRGAVPASCLVGARPGLMPPPRQRTVQARPPLFDAPPTDSSAAHTRLAALPPRLGSAAGATAAPFVVHNAGPATRGLADPTQQQQQQLLLRHLGEEQQLLLLSELLGLQGADARGAMQAILASPAGGAAVQQLLAQLLC